MAGLYRRRTVPTQLAALAAGVPESTVRKWASRGKLTRFGRPGRAEYDLDELYVIVQQRAAPDQAAAVNAVMLLYMPMLSLVLPLWVVERTAAPRPVVSAMFLLNTLAVVAVVVTAGKRPVSEVARSYGVARSWICTLLARSRAEGDAAFEPRSRRPKTSPSAISAQAVELIIRLRKELAGQGLDAGPHTIAWHLAHHHGTRVSAATISRYLARAGFVTPEPNTRPSPPASGSPRSSPTSAGKQTSPTTRSPARQTPRS